MNTQIKVKLITIYIAYLYVHLWFLVIKSTNSAPEINDRQSYHLTFSSSAAQKP